MRSLSIANAVIYTAILGALGILFSELPLIILATCLVKSPYITGTTTSAPAPSL